MDLFDLASYRGEFALDRKRVLDVVGPVVQVEQRLLGREQVTLLRLEIHVLLGHVLPGDGIRRDRLAESSQLTEGILELLRGHGDYEVSVRRVARAVALRAERRPPEAGRDLLGPGRLALDILRGYAKLRRLDDLTPEVVLRNRGF